ncbi:hypothetical protein E2I00_007217, partial [Balaenoptera physalus]
KCQQGGGGTAELDLPQVHLRPRGPRPATGHGLRAADAAASSHHLQACEARPAGHGGHALLPLRCPQ